MSIPTIPINSISIQSPTTEEPIEDGEEEEHGFTVVTKGSHKRGKRKDGKTKTERAVDQYKSYLKSRIEKAVQHIEEGSTNGPVIVNPQWTFERQFKFHELHYGIQGDTNNWRDRFLHPAWGETNGQRPFYQVIEELQTLEKDPLYLRDVTQDDDDDGKIHLMIFLEPPSQQIERMMKKQWHY